MPTTALRSILNSDIDLRSASTSGHLGESLETNSFPINPPNNYGDRFSFDTIDGDRTWRLDELDVRLEHGHGILWQAMKPQARPSFTHGLLADLNAVADGVQAAYERQPALMSRMLRFIVTGSGLPGIFNLGGDLGLFLSLIESRDRDGLLRYARACARGQHRLHAAFDVPVCMVALVQGDALGGGFEAALAHDVIIAEHQAQFGLPEVLFNLFPGMGAYSFLSRRIGAAAAERMILAGRVYSAEELHGLGVIDQIVPEGEGPAAVHDFAAEYSRSLSRQAVMKTRKIVGGVPIAELINVADVWVETALRLEKGDLRRMAHLARAQDRRYARIAERA